MLDGASTEREEKGVGGEAQRPLLGEGEGERRRRKRSKTRERHV